MKTWTINSNLAALSLGAFLAACSGVDQSASGDEAGLESVDPTMVADSEFGEAGEAITSCDDLQYDHWRHLAALGVAAAQELGRWQPTVDFVSNPNTGISLSAAGLARCKDGCDNIQAILSLQNNGAGVIPRHDPYVLKGKFISFFERQVHYAQQNGIIEHELVPTTVSSAACGLRYWFSAKQAGQKYAGTTTLVAAHSNKCMDVAGVSTNNGAAIQQWDCTGAANQKFTLESQSNGAYRLKANHSGKCMRMTTNQAGAKVDQNACDTSTSQMFDLVPKNGKFQLKNRSGGMCLDVSGVSTASGAALTGWHCGTGNNQLFSMAVTSTNTGAALPNPERLVNNMLWIGSVENKYLDFKSTATEVSIDPMGAMVDGASTAQSGSCTVGATLVDSTRTSTGKCCEVEKIQGKYQPTTWNKSLYLCKM